MQKFYFLVVARVENKDLSKISKMPFTIESNVFDESFKSRSIKYSESTEVYIKIESDYNVPQLSFLRSLLEKALDIELFEISLTHITHEIYLEKNIIHDENHIDEVSDCIEMIKHYQSKLRYAKVSDKRFDFKLFEKSGNSFIEQLEIAHKSTRVKLEKDVESDFIYFNYSQKSNNVVLHRLLLDNVV